MPKRPLEGGSSIDPKQRKLEELTILDLPDEVLAVILCTYSRPWETVLKCVCRVWYDILIDKRLRCTQFPYEAEKISNDLGIHFEQKWDLIKISQLEEFESKGYRFKSDLPWDDEAALSYDEIVVLSYGKVSKWAFDEVRHLAEKNQEIVDNSVLYRHERMSDHINYIYMLYAEAARGNVPFIRWLLSKNARMDPVIFYGIFYSGCTEMISLLNQARAFPSYKMEASTVLEKFCFGKQNDHNMMLRAAGVLYTRQRGQTSLADVFMTRSDILKSHDNFKDYVRIAAARGHLGLFQYIEAMVEEAEMLTQSAVSKKLVPQTRALWNFTTHSLSTRFGHTEESFFQPEEPNPCAELDCYCVPLDVSKDNCKCQVFRFCSMAKEVIDRGDWQDPVTESIAPPFPLGVVKGTPLGTILFENGPLYTAAKHGHVEFLLWLRERNFKAKVRNNMMRDATQREREAVISMMRMGNRVLVENRECGYATGVLEAALSEGRYEDYLDLLNGGYVIHKAEDIKRFLDKHPHQAATFADMLMGDDL